jgi:hypothetical protein
MKSKIDVINETANFYNINNRSSDPENTRFDGSSPCLYNGPNNTRCAFARCCNEEDIKHLPEGESVQGHMLEYLKPEYKNVTDVGFWKSIQHFHDSEMFWNETGLTPEGISERDRLLGMYDI